MAYDPKRALELLRIGSGRADATFRDGQEDAIRHIVDGIPTGWFCAVFKRRTNVG